MYYLYVCTWKRKVKMGVPHVCMLSCFSCVRLFGTPGTVAHQVPLSMKFCRPETVAHQVPLSMKFCRPGTVAHQAPLSMEFSRQEYWSGWPRDPTTSPAAPALKADSFSSEPQEKPLRLSLVQLFATQARIL